MHPDAIDLACRWRRSRRRGWHRPLAGKRRMGGVERHEIGRRAGGDAATARRRARRCRRRAPRRTARVPSSRRRPPAHCGRDGRGAANIRAGAIRRRTPISTFESEPTPKRPPCVDEQRRGEDAVAEIGLGDRAEAGDRAAPGHADRFRPRSCGWRGSGTSARSTGGIGRAAIRPAARRTRRGSPRPP